MMSNKKSQNQKNWIWGIGAILVILLFSGCDSLAEAPAIAPVQQVETIDVDQAYQLYTGGVAFLDVRTPEEWQSSHIPGATFLPLDQVKSQVDNLPRDQEIVIYCRSGNRSVEAAQILLEAGFENITSMDGGINDWISAGYEVDIGN